MGRNQLPAIAYSEGEALSVARHSSINTTLVYSTNIDRVNNAGEFAIDKMLGRDT